MKADSSKSFRRSVSIRPALPAIIVLALITLLALIYSRRHSSFEKQKPIMLAPIAADSSERQERATRNFKTEIWPELRSKMPSDIHQLISDLSNPSLPLKIRRAAARALALNGSDEAFAALTRALIDGPPYLNAAIAEALGECPNPEAPALLIELLNGAEEAVARGAVRGIAAHGDAQAVDTLGEILNDLKRPLSVRTEAALALGDVSYPEASTLLMRALTDAKDITIIEGILAGLGKRSFDETAEFFTGYLNSAEASSQAKVAAIEALSNTQGDASSLLMKCLADPDPLIRAAAAWALSTSDQQNLGSQLSNLLRDEPSPDVRIRLYQAIENQSSVDSPVILARVQAETLPLARLAGLDCLAAQLRHSTTPELITFFQQIAFPELGNTALNSKDAQLRLGSVIALSRAGSAASGVLQNVAQNSNDRQVVQAAQAALKPLAKR